MKNNPTPNETFIRDFLIENLSIIEPDLILIDKEFTIPNSVGAGGRIDILAKDKFGMYVIVELKKSNVSARQALHELQKYIALFKTNYGIASEKCRCILLSTEWHELLVPFSEFSRIVDYQMDGYQLILNEEGMPISKTSISLVPEGEERFIFPRHNIYLYETNENREIAKEKLEDILKKIKIKDYALLIINYEGDSEKVIYPFALYLVIDYLKKLDKEIIKQDLGILDIDDIDDIDEEVNNQPVIEEEILSEITNRLLDLIDTMEGGCAESLQHMISNGWFVNKTCRGNRTSLKLLITDEEILKEIISFEGGNSVIYTSVTTPKIQPLWKATSEKLKHFLYSNFFWNVGSEWFLKKVESTSTKATVNLRIYDACDILKSLYNYYCRSVNYFPSLELVAQIPGENGENNKTIILVGFLEWDRHTFPDITSIFQNREPSQVFLREELFFKERPYSNLIMMLKHGINYTLFEIILEKNLQPVIKRLVLEENESITSVSITDEIGESLEDFFIYNPQYLEELCYMGSLCFHFL